MWIQHNTFSEWTPSLQHLGESQISLWYVDMVRPAHRKSPADYRGKLLDPEKGRQPSTSIHSPQCPHTKLRWHALWGAEVLPSMVVYVASGTDDIVNRWGMSTQVSIPPNCQMTHAKKFAKEPAKARELRSERCSGAEPSFIYSFHYFLCPWRAN